MFGSSRVELISSQKSILIKVRNCIFLYSIQFERESISYIELTHSRSIFVTKTKQTLNQVAKLINNAINYTITLAKPASAALAFCRDAKFGLPHYSN